MKIRTFLAAMVTVALLTLWIGAAEPTTRQATHAWLTFDDGKSWFSADAKVIPPVVRGGRECVRAHVFYIEGEPNRQFVGYLTRYTPEAQALFEEIEMRDDPTPTAEDAAKIAQGTEVKRPGETEWKRLVDVGPIQIAAPEGAKLIAVLP